MYRLINNRIRCKFCGDIIQSLTIHDFVRCKCGKCSTDGGLEYAQRSFFTENPEDTYEDLSMYLDTETGKIVKAKDMNPENMPLRPIRVEIKKVEDEPETPHDILGKLSNMTPEEMKAEAEKIVSDHHSVPDIPEVTEADEAEPLKEEKVVKRDENGKPIAGRYPYRKK